MPQRRKSPKRDQHEATNTETGCKRRTVVLQLALPSYRQGLLDHLEQQAAPVTFYVGDQQFVTDVRTDVHSPLVTRTGSNIFVLGRRLAWQRGVLRVGVAADVCVVEANPRILSTWATVLARKIIGRRTTGWGHVAPRRGPGAPTAKLRRALFSLLDTFVAYTPAEADTVSKELPGVEVVVAHNALYPEAQVIPVVEDTAVDVIWLGRLAPGKNPALAVEVFASAAPRLPEGAQLVVVGEGALREEVRRLADELEIGGRVRTVGSVTKHQALASLFATSSVMLATGYVGLNVTQSLGFGCPVVFPRRVDHAPEAALLHEGNSRAYDETAVEDGARALLELMGMATPAMRRSISAEVRRAYTTERMAQTFLLLSIDGPARSVPYSSTAASNDEEEH